MRLVREVLRKKPAGITSVSPDTTVFEMLGVMAERNVGAVVVIEDGRLAGIVSERDYARSVVLKGRSSKDTPVREIMTARVVTVTPEHRVRDCMALMTDKRVRHLPVLEDGRLVGVVSIGDVVKEVIAEQESLIADLEHYIDPAR